MPPRALAPLALMAVIFILSADPSPGPGLSPFTRALAHFAEYALLAGLWIWALAPAMRPGAALALAATIAFLYALSDEYHQSFVPGRDPDPLDVVVDSLGIATTLLAARFVSARARDRRRARRAPGPPA